MKKSIRFISLIIIVGVIFTVYAFAITLLTEDKALKEMFPDANGIVVETKTLTYEQYNEIKERLGGKMVESKNGEKADEIDKKREYDFYFAMKDDQKIGVAVIETQPGKWGPVTFIIALDTEGKVKNLAVMSYKEKRGRPIARRHFLGQFIGKTVENPFRLRRGIRAISGATISSRCTVFTVKKVLTMYDVIYNKVDQ